jgi:hypothetical protein
MKTRWFKPNVRFLFVATRVWATEILIAGFNYFVLMNAVYEPLWGERVAHQIGMSTRIICIFTLAYLLLRFAEEYSTADLVHAGVLWLTLTLIFEWVGSLAIGRPVDEILAGWHVENGYMWPYVLAAYASANLIVGKALHPSRGGAHDLATVTARR